MSNNTRHEVMDDTFWEEFGDIKELKASKNKLLPYSGIGFIYGLPASRKTTIAIDTIKTMEDFSEYLYVDMDSKTIKQAKDTYDSLSKIGWKYFNTMLQDAGARDVVSIIETLERNSVVIIDTWHQIIGGESENDNDYAKKVMKVLRAEALKNDLLIVLLAHSGKTNNDIRGASSVSGDATFKVLVSKNKEVCTLEVTKDSTGLLTSSTAIITKEDTITDTIIQYSTDIIEENKMKPKEAAVTQTLLNRVNEILNEGLPCSIGELRDWLYDNYNSTNEFLPDDKLFCSNRYLRDNFVDFTESLFIIEKTGRSKFIKGFIYDKHIEK